MDRPDETRAAGLMRAALSGDEAAYADFLRLAAALVRGFASRRLSRDVSIGAEDIVQDVLLAIHVKRHTWRTGEPVLPWVFTIARHKLVDAYRKAGSRVFVDVADFEERLAAPETEAGLPERQVEAALVALSAGQQRVVRSIALDGRSISETAAAFEMKETAVRVAFHRGLAAIAARFGRQT